MDFPLSLSRPLLFVRVLWCVGALTLLGRVANAAYPLTTLRCYSTFTKPDSQLICPEARAKYCVKEVSTLRQDLCGHTQYFGDTYILNICVTRKCAAECEDKSYQFEYGGVEYTRVRSCCTTDYCNTATRAKKGSVLLSAICIACLSLWFALWR